MLSRAALLYSAGEAPARNAGVKFLPVQILAAVLASSLLAAVCGSVMGDGPVPGASASHMGDPGEAPGQLDLALAIAAIWGMN